MYIFKKNLDLIEFLDGARARGERIGFAPTMGALHAGHLELLRQALAENEVGVVSIFVNPTQFNDKEDLAKYPRPIEQDIYLLERAGCTVLYLPDEGEIYPPGLPEVRFDLGGLVKGMEGAHRPGHFEGVVQVVHRLLDIVRPDALYMGQKDFQQFAVIKAMLGQMRSPIRLVRVGIVREPDGLAMSSRNVRLTPQGRSRAALISQTLFQAQSDARHLPLSQVRSRAEQALVQAELECDYLEFVDADSLQPVERFDQAPSVAVCIVVRIDGVRLLDNAILT